MNRTGEYNTWRLAALIAGVAIGCSVRIAEADSAASAKIAVRDLDRDGDSSSSGLERQTFMRAQAGLILSRPVIYTVISNLNLQAAWAGASGPISLEQACERVMDQTQVAPYRDTSLISIEVRDPDLHLSARLANEIAAVFREMQISRQRDEVLRQMETIKKELRKQETKVAEAEKQAEAIRRQLGVSAMDRIKDSPEEIAAMKTEAIALRVVVEARKVRADTIGSMNDAELVKVAESLVTNLPASSLRGIDTQARAETAPSKESLDALRRAARADYEVALARLDALEAHLAAHEKHADPSERARLEPLDKAERNVQVQREILGALRVRLAQEEVQLTVPRIPVEIVDLANPPGK